MSLIYVVFPMPELPWGINRVFKYIGFYAVGVFLAGRKTKIADRNVGTGVAAVAYCKFLLISLQLNHRAYVVCDSTYWCYCYDSDLSVHQ